MIARSYEYFLTADAEYSYDANGNMQVGTARTWDVENRLTSITENGITTDYVYDGNGNRVEQTVEGTPDVTTLYINQYYERKGGQVTTYYYLGGKLIAQNVDGDIQYIHQDSLGSTSLMTDEDGDLISIITYLPFGQTRSGSVPTDKQFTGQRLDDTGLYYYSARYYDPLIGRFISPDTVVQNPSDPQSLNRYSYCLNNPLIYTDPSGNIVDIYGVNVDSCFWGNTSGIEYKFLSEEGAVELYEAWEQYKSVEPEYAGEMENSDDNVFNINWWSSSGGETRPLGGTSVNGAINYSISYYDVSIPDAYKNDTIGAAVIIGHESVHAITYMDCGLHYDSKYEEIMAYQFEGIVAGELGYSSKVGDASFNLIGGNIWAANYLIDSELNYGNWILSSELWVWGQIVNRNYRNCPNFPSMNVFNFLRSHFDIFYWLNTA